MYFKIIFFAAALCIAAARPQAGHGHGHEHGHATSSQSIVLHQTHHAPQHHQSAHAAPHHEHHEEHHGHSHGHATSAQSVVLHQTHHAPQHHQQSTHETHHHEHHEEHHGHPKYEFEYKVEDKHTGDIKSQHESRDGDVVKGYYSLHEADGTVRIVHYNADKHNGFNAIVERKGHAKHIEPVHHHH